MMYLAAAGALYAWRSYAQARKEEPARATPSPSGRERANAGDEDRSGAGITDLPSSTEHAQQDTLPPRGTRKSESHA